MEAWDYAASQQANLQNLRDANGEAQRIRQ